MRFSLFIAIAAIAGTLMPVEMARAQGFPSPAMTVGTRIVSNVITGARMVRDAHPV